MLNILSIGNSFSQDSTTYLYQMARSAGIEVQVVNLYIGGCSMERHWNNICEDIRECNYQRNGVDTDRYVGIKETLQEEKWDIVTIQQCSGFSGILSSYYPYGANLTQFIKQHAPGAKILIHQTWAYEIDSDHGHFEFYHRDQQEMYRNLVQCYDTIARELSLEIIPFGETIQKLRTLPPFDYENGGKSLCRDGFHMDYIYGRFALAAVWFEFVLHGDIRNNEYVPVVEGEAEPSKEVLDQIRQCVHELAQQKRV